MAPKFPYPTVATVYKAQYTHSKYNIDGSSSKRLNLTTQVSVLKSLYLAVKYQRQETKWIKKIEITTVKSILIIAGLTLNDERIFSII
jgi:hypothetical protein